MLFANGGFSSRQASSLFRQINPAVDSNPDPIVFGQLAPETSELPFVFSSGPEIDSLETSFDVLLMDPAGEAHADEPETSHAEQQAVEQDTAQQKAAEQAEQQARAEQEAAARLERERAEQARIEQQKTQARSQDKELINQESRAVTLFRIAFRQLTGEDSSAQDLKKWQKEVQHPTTDLDKARADVLAVRPEIKDRLVSSDNPKVFEQRKAAIGSVAGRLNLGSTERARLERDFANRPGSIQGLVREMLNQYA